MAPPCFTGNLYFQQGAFKTAIQWYSKALHASDLTSIERSRCLSNRSASYLKLAVENKFDSLLYYKLALQDAIECIKEDPDWSRGYGRLGAAYVALGKKHEAIDAYKKGIEREPENSVLQEGLQCARIALLNDMITEGDEKEENEDSIISSNAPVQNTALTYLDSISRVDPTTLIRLVCIHTFLHLKKVSQLKWGISLLATGLFFSAVHHVFKIILVVLFLGVLYVYDRRHQSVLHVWIWNRLDKIRVSLLFIPSFIVLLPLFMNVYGLFKLFRFVTDDTLLSSFMFLTLTALLCTPHERLIGLQIKRSKVNKLAAHAVLVLYWVILCRHHEDFFKCVAPFCINAAGCLLTSIPSSELQMALRHGLSNALSEIAMTLGKDMSMDMWMLVGTLQWLVRD